MFGNILDRILERTKLKVAERKLLLPLAELKQDNGFTRYPGRDFKESLRNPCRISVIAELKRASPSAGVIRKNFKPGEIINAYQECGADAVSVVTEEEFFSGSLENIAVVKKKSVLPALMKDFIIDEYQLYEAARGGADAVLLIAGILPGAKLSDFLQHARGLGMDSLVETRDAGEVERAVSAGAEIIGINNRNLETFAVDIRTSLELLEFIPGSIVRVSESGIHTGEDLSVLREAGADAVLIGETLMRAESPGEKLREIISHA